MRYRFHPEALEEYQQAALYYAERGQAIRLVSARKAMRRERKEYKEK
jgi:uncharacterized DUF497 family protein